MKYKKAQEILPEEIIKIIQEYMDGGYLYIPRKIENRKSWGENSGVLNELEVRNKNIFKDYMDGSSIKELAKNYYLSEASIKRIVGLVKKTGS
ncbi:MAG: hypothetical protein E7213_03135 [Clostridium sp.]|jgi:Mor family transcriptional regulator|nr:hypothetical protein [Clostridium sp.]